MISEKLNVPESVADFIEGRTPKKIGYSLLFKAWLIKLMNTTASLQSMFNYCTLKQEVRQTENQSCSK